LFTDIEGSTSLLKKLGNRYEGILSEHETVLREAFLASAGRVVDTQGDAFFVAFRRARDAVEAAVAAQRALAGHAWPEGGEVRVRMGIHTGEPTVGGERYVGLGVHRASRICAAGHGGQVLISQTTRELLRDDPPAGASLRDLGNVRLKDLDEPERIYQLIATGLGDEFPPLTSAGDEDGGVVEAIAEFRILGPLEVVLGSHVLPITGRKQRSLLAILLLSSNQVVSTERLVDHLWGERPPRTAVTSLQNFVAQLRKLLGPGLLVTQSPGYTLVVSPTQVDAARFERVLAEGRGLAPELSAERLREALSLWRGPALADFAYEAFAETEARRLEELRLEALEARIEADLELGRHSAAVAELESLVALHPLRERLRRQLMLALYRSGRQADALEAYQQARRVLVEELGIDPSPELQQLHASILRQDSHLVARESVTPEEDHLEYVVKVLLAGKLVPVVGGGVAANGAESAPAADAVAARLAESFSYPDAVVELPRVSQYVATLTGPGPLYDELHDLFLAGSAPRSLHGFLASLPPLLRERSAPHQLIVTTNYDLALEQAFLEAGEEFDVVAYLATGRHRGRFCHVAPDGSASVIDLPNTYASELSLQRRTVILKVHGQVDPGDAREWESFLVTEDDYIGYLAQSDLASVMPVSLVATLRRSHFLFLGYRLQDWNLRVILNRLWGDATVAYRSWAVQPAPAPLERAFWRQRDVEAIDAAVDEYVEALGRRLDAARTESPG
jgi:DNA-binding SARP family transcriptional activator/class 3 adenylate cyclase